MVLETKRGKNLPPGAVSVTEEEALEYQRKFIDIWPSKTDVFFLKYGAYMNSASTVISSVVAMNHFKQYFKLHFSPYFVFSYLTSGIIPSIFSFYITEKLLTETLRAHVVGNLIFWICFLTNNVLLMKMDCPICYELKFAASQLYASVVYPAIFSYFNLGSRALAENTYNLPNIKTHPREFWKETFRIFKNSAPVFKFVALGQSLWVLFLPYMQNKQLYNVMNKARKAAVNEETLMD